MSLNFDNDESLADRVARLPPKDNRLQAMLDVMSRGRRHVIYVRIVATQEVLCVQFLSTEQAKIRLKRNCANQWLTRFILTKLFVCHSKSASGDEFALELSDIPERDKDRSMLRESRLRNNSVRPNDERATSSNDDMIHNVWQKYRPKAAINFSDLVEERSMDGCLASPSVSSPNLGKPSFEPTEITGRSTGRNRNVYGAPTITDMSVDDILSDSFVHQIRNMGTKNRPLDTGNTTNQRTSLPSNYMTASSSLMSKGNDVASIVSCNGLNSASVMSEEFAPFDQMQDQLNQDEREWQNEYGVLPAESERSGTSITSSSKVSGIDPKRNTKLVNLTEFSGYLAESNRTENSSANYSTMSMGQFFAKRCEDVRDMIPSRSPTKSKPIALVGDSYRSASDYNTSSESNKYSQASSSFYTDDELRIRSMPRVTNATYDKKSIMSVSTIAAKLDDESNESPATFVSKYASALRSMTSKSSTLSSVSSATSNVGSIPSSTAAFTTANRSIGMLAQMNSTRIDESDKENHREQHRNSSAETEPAEFSHFLDDFTSEASDKDSNLPHKATNTNRAGLDPPHQPSNLKRMRSPQPTSVSTAAHIRPAERHVEYPKRVSPMKSQEINDIRTYAVDDREFAAGLHRSPIDGSKFSLPNYGLRNSARGLSQSPTAYPVRSSSQLSTNSEFSQNDGKFPLKANKNQLTWECVKLQKSVTKSFVVKNTSHKRLSLKLHIAGPGFTTVQDEGPLVLQGNECRTISVIFCPTVVGKAIGKVTFKPTKVWPDETERSIHLYGYGGHTTLQLQGIERGPIGVSFLKMGETSNIRSTTLQRVFFIYNKGPLNGMATISVKPKTNQYIHETHIQIEPKKCVIRPDTSVKVNVTYKLRRKDLEKLTHKSCDVLTVATLEVIMGADPNRQRIATILTRWPTIPAPYHSLEFLVKDFPQDSVEEFSDFGEDIDHIADLFNCFKTSDVALTINRTTLDETRDTCTDLSGIEDSVFFHTLVDDRVRDAGHSHGMQSDATNDKQRNPFDEETWSVYPTRLVMDQADNNRKQLTIRNDFNKSQTFQVEANFCHLFALSPTSGMIQPGKECTIDVQLKTNIYVPSDVKLTVLIESDSIEIPVTVRKAPPSAPMSYK